MKRKIAAIVAADIAGYSRLVAEDEEETLRRLASYRAVFDDFIARGAGRVFNTAGDAILAEFPSAVEAVRCAIDIQESLRTRNLAYPASRQMSFRIGITIGDVVERDGDLLGDGVNIAARLQTLAAPGGICVSRTVHEQVANKLSVQFADIGEQEVKNIPTPVHAYTLALGSEDAALQPRPRLDKTAGRRSPRFLPAGIALAGVVAIGIAILVYVALQRSTPSGGLVVSQPNNLQEPRPQVAQRPAEPLVPEIVPRIADRGRVIIREQYLPAPDHKAIAISAVRMGFMTGQKDDDAAKAGAMDMCQKATDALGPGHTCELYAVGDTVVYARGRPPMPQQATLIRDPSIERPFSVDAVPLLREQIRDKFGAAFSQGKRPKAAAISPGGSGSVHFGGASVDEVVRRALENCGLQAGVPCLTIAVDDVFVVPISTTMRIVGFFTPSRDDIAPEMRDGIAQQLRSAATGWNAVAVGSSGRPGLALRMASEQEAVAGALADCARHDRNCHVVAIGPFSVEPN
jgi:class 3 adenylate cyclase